MIEEVSAQFWIILGVAITLLIVGIVIYLRLIRRSNPKLFYSNAIISWLLISLFPVVLLFSIFQDNSVTGVFEQSGFATITVGGAFGAFFVLWIMGTWNTLKAINADYNEETIKALNEQISNLQDQFHKLDATPKDTTIISECSKIEYDFTYGKKRTLGLITGDIQQVRGIDLWVNSENTNFQMARYYDSSISGLIRYLGAVRDKEGNVIVDTIADALKDCVLEKKPEDGVKMIHFPSVKPGLAFTTTSGCLQATHGVQRIIHVATVFGEIGQGYVPIKNVGICVRNALEQADQFALSENKKKVSILFPLFGTGTAGGSLDLVAKNLFYSVLAYFETKRSSKVDKIYFLVWKQYEKTACVNVLEKMHGLIPKQPT